MIFVYTILICSSTGLNESAKSFVFLRTLKSKNNFKMRRRRVLRENDDEEDEDEEDEDEKSDATTSTQAENTSQNNMNDIPTTEVESSSTNFHDITATEFESLSTKSFNDISTTEFESSAYQDFNDVSTTPFESSQTKNVNDMLPTEFENSSTTNFHEITMVQFESSTTKNSFNSTHHDETLESLSTKAFSAVSSTIQDNESTESEKTTITTENILNSTNHETNTEAYESTILETTNHIQKSTATLEMTDHTEKSTATLETKSTGATTTKKFKFKPTIKMLNKMKNKSTTPIHKTTIQQFTVNVGVTSTANIDVTSPNTNIDVEENTEKIKAIDYYEKIMPEYGFEIEELKSENFTYNFTDDEIETTLRKMIKKTFDLKKPQNCSDFAGSKFSIGALKCAISDFRKVKNSTEVKEVFGRYWKIIKVWLCVYIFIAIPCWCHKGKNL